MAIDFDCSGCGRTYRVDEALAGKRTKCKICDAILTVPSPSLKASRPPLQTFGAAAAPSPRPAFAPISTPRPKLSPEPEHSAAHLYGIEDADDGPAHARPSYDYDDEPEEEIQGPRRPSRPGQAMGKGKASRRELAGILGRFAASLIDGVFLIVVLFVCFFLSGVAVGIYVSSQGRQVTPEDIAAAVMYCYIGWVVFTYLYYAGMTSSSHQATLGKLAMGIRICDLDGRPIGFGRALLRELAKILSSFFLIGFIMAFFTEKKQALHDIMLQTLVVKV